MAKAHSSIASPISLPQLASNLSKFQSGTFKTFLAAQGKDLAVAPWKTPQVH